MPIDQARLRKGPSMAEPATQRGTGAKRDATRVAPSGPRGFGGLRGDVADSRPVAVDGRFDPSSVRPVRRVRAPARAPNPRPG